MEPVSVRTRSPGLAELETLVACAAEGSMAAAAGLLGISRPAIAKRIRNLELIAGQPLLHRSGRGVALTDAGASLLGSARRLLDERDVLLEALAKIRGEQAFAVDGLRRLLSSSPAHARAAQQPEARLAEAEELLEHVLRASRTGLAISDPDTGEILVVNDAFCQIVGLAREELVGKAPSVWADPAARERVVEEVRRTGVAHSVPISILRPDGTVAMTSTSGRLITLGGGQQVLWCVDEVGDGHARGAARQGHVPAPGPRVAAPHTEHSR